MLEHTKTARELSIPEIAILIQDKAELLEALKEIRSGSLDDIQMMAVAHSAIKKAEEDEENLY